MSGRAIVGRRTGGRRALSEVYRLVNLLKTPYIKTSVRRFFCFISGLSNMVKVECRDECRSLMSYTCDKCVYNRLRLQDVVVHVNVQH